MLVCDTFRGGCRVLGIFTVSLVFNTVDVVYLGVLTLFHFIISAVWSEWKHDWRETTWRDVSGGGDSKQQTGGEQTARENGSRSRRRQR